jgi:hypothetical protein
MDQPEIIYRFGRVGEYTVTLRVTSSAGVIEVSGNVLVEESQIHIPLLFRPGN